MSIIPMPPTHAEVSAEHQARHNDALSHLVGGADLVAPVDTPERIWVLREFGVIVECAPDRSVVLGDTRFSDGAHRCASRYAWTVHNGFRRIIDDAPDAEFYDLGAYTLGLEVHGGAR